MARHLLLAAGLAVLVAAPVMAGENPILLVHGFCGSRDTWASAEAALRGPGGVKIVSHTFDPNGDGLANDAPRRIAEQLAARIDGMRAAHDSAQVDIVAHSMGGLASRAYVTSGRHRATIGRLAMLGTPNHGAYLAEVALGDVRFPGAGILGLTPYSPLASRLARALDGQGRYLDALAEALRLEACLGTVSDALEDLRPHSSFLRHLNGNRKCAGRRDPEQPDDALPGPPPGYRLIAGVGVLAPPTLSHEDLEWLEELTSEAGETLEFSVPVFRDGDGVVPLLSARVDGVGTLTSSTTGHSGLAGAAAVRRALDLVRDDTEPGPSRPAGAARDDDHTSLPSRTDETPWPGRSVPSAWDGGRPRPVARLASLTPLTAPLVAAPAAEHPSPAGLLVPQLLAGGACCGGSFRVDELAQRLRVYVIAPVEKRSQAGERGAAGADGIEIELSLHGQPFPSTAPRDGLEVTRGPSGLEVVIPDPPAGDWSLEILGAGHAAPSYRWLAAQESSAWIAVGVPDRPVDGEEVTITAYLQRSGKGARAPVFAAVAGPDGEIDRVTLEPRAVAGLSSGRYRPGMSGVYSVVAAAAASEHDPAVRFGFGSFEVRRSPRLTITGLAHRPTRDPETVRLEARIENSGAQEAPETAVFFYTAPPDQGGRLIGVGGVSFTAGSPSVRTVELETSLAPGRYRLFAAVDPFNRWLVPPENRLANAATLDIEVPRWGRYLRLALGGGARIGGGEVVLSRPTGETVAQASLRDGFVAGVAVGRILGRAWRLEGELLLSGNDLQPEAPLDLGELETTSLSLNLYRHFRKPFSRWNPYVGLGLTRLDDVELSAAVREEADPPGPPARRSLVSAGWGHQAMVGLQGRLSQRWLWTLEGRHLNADLELEGGDLLGRAAHDTYSVILGLGTWF